MYYYNLKSFKILMSGNEQDNEQATTRPQAKIRLYVGIHENKVKIRNNKHKKIIVIVTKTNFIKTSARLSDRGNTRCTALRSSSTKTY